MITMYCHMCPQKAGERGGGQTVSGTEQAGPGGPHTISGVSLSISVFSCCKELEERERKEGGGRRER